MEYTLRQFMDNSNTFDLIFSGDLDEETYEDLVDKLENIGIDIEKTPYLDGEYFIYVWGLRVPIEIKINNLHGLLAELGYIYNEEKFVEIKKQTIYVFTDSDKDYEEIMFVHKEYYDDFDCLEDITPERLNEYLSAYDICEVSESTWEYSLELDTVEEFLSAMQGNPYYDFQYKGEME